MHVRALDCTSMQSYIGRDLRDLTGLTPGLVALCCHLPPEGARISAGRTFSAPWRSLRSPGRRSGV